MLVAEGAAAPSKQLLADPQRKEVAGPSRQLDSSLLPLDQLVALITSEAHTLQSLTRRNWSQHGRTPVFSRIAKVCLTIPRMDPHL
jgi:hypothetical protein